MCWLWRQKLWIRRVRFSFHSVRFKWIFYRHLHVKIIYVEPFSLSQSVAMPHFVCPHFGPSIVMCSLPWDIAGWYFRKLITILIFFVISYRQQVGCTNPLWIPRRFDWNMNCCVACVFLLFALSIRRNLSRRFIVSLQLIIHFDDHRINEKCSAVQ